MKKRYLIYTSLVLAIGLASCDKENLEYEELTDSKEGAVIFTAKARNGIQALKTYSIEEAQFLEKDTITFNAGIGSVGLPANNIDVTFSLDTNVFDSINAIRVINGQKLYKPFPDGSYEVNSLKLTIPKGEEYSNISTVIYDPEKFDTDSNYLIAFTITDASGYKINREVKTVIFSVLEVIIPDPEPDYYEKADWELISATSEEVAGEGSNGFASNIIDGNVNTYWHSCWSGCSTEQSTYPHILTVDMKNVKDLDGIEFAQRQSGTRGVNLIEIEVSDDNTDWRSLGEFNLLNVTAPQLVEFEEIEAFRYFRITIKSGYDDGGAAFNALGEVSPYILK